jgi:predicted ArsR family transcriptional regulator
VSEPSLVERGFYALFFRAERDPRARAALIALVNVAFRAIALERRRGGRRLFDYAAKAAARFGRWRAPRVRDALGIDVASMDDLARVQDWEDRACGVTGHWTERSAHAATKCETACPFAKAASEAPEICEQVIHALETATFRELNPSYRLVPLERLLSKGDTRCEFRHVID